MAEPAWRSNWRYQPVWVDDYGERYYCLCEIYLDGDGLLRNWAGEPVVCPGGDTSAELGGDLARMVIAHCKWLPVPYADLRVGMTFARTGVDLAPLIAALERATADHRPATREPDHG